MKKKYLLPCSCGREIPVGTSQAGDRVVCKCGAELDVPTMLGLARLEEVVEAEPAAKTKRPTWGIRQGLPLLGGILILAGAAAATVLWFGRPRAPDVTRLSPSSAIPLWREFRKGISSELTLPERLYREASRWYRGWMILAGGVGLVGVLMIVVARLVGRPSQNAPPPDPTGPPDRAAEG